MASECHGYSLSIEEYNRRDAVAVFNDNDGQTSVNEQKNEKE